MHIQPRVGRYQKSIEEHFSPRGYAENHQPREVSRIQTTNLVI